MALPNPYQSYRNQQINTASQDKLILMLFDGAIRFCHQAKDALEQKKFEEANTFLTKAQNIVQEFMVTLDMQQEIAHNLYALYDYFYRRLIDANIKKDPAIVTEVVSFLADLRETFAQAGLQARANNQSLTGGAVLED